MGLTWVGVRGQHVEKQCIGIGVPIANYDAKMLQWLLYSILYYYNYVNVSTFIYFYEIIKTTYILHANRKFLLFKNN